MINNTQNKHLLIIQYNHNNLGVTLSNNKIQTINQIINGTFYNNSSNIELFMNLIFAIKDYYLSLPNEWDNIHATELIINKFPESKLNICNITESAHMNKHFNFDKAFYGAEQKQHYIDQWFKYECKFRFTGQKILREYNCLEHIVKIIQEKININKFDFNNKFLTKLMNEVEENEINLHASIDEMLSSRWNIESI